MIGFSILLTYCLVGIFALVIALIVGVISSSIAHRTNSLGESAKIWVGVGTAVLTLFIICGGYTYLLPNSYRYYRGIADYYRQPLHYPYQLEMIDSLDCATVNRWPDQSERISGISHYEQRDHLLIGKISADCIFSSQDQWFILNMNTGRYDSSVTHADWQNKIHALGFDRNIQLATVQENWYAH